MVNGILEELKNIVMLQFNQMKHQVSELQTQLIKSTNSHYLKDNRKTEHSVTSSDTVYRIRLIGQTNYPLPPSWDL